MLDRTPDTLRTEVEAERADDERRASDAVATAPDCCGGPGSSSSHLSFSSLTRRIVFLNVAGLLALRDRHSLSLAVPRRPDRRAHPEPAGAGRDHRRRDRRLRRRSIPTAATIDPDRLLELQPGESYGPSEDGVVGLEFPINPERVAPVLRRLVSPTNTRARIYDRDGMLILDSRALRRRAALRPAAARARRSRATSSARWIALRRWLARGDLPLYRELGAGNGKGYAEVAHALTGLKSSMVRINERGEVIVSVAVPVQRFRAVRGALMLSTQGADIDDMVDGRAAGDLQGVPGRGRRDGRAVVPARRHHRRPGAPARRRPPTSCAGASARAWRFPTSPIAATRSGICPARCAT